MADNSEQIDEVQEIIRAATTETNVDGQVTKFVAPGDLRKLQRELTEADPEKRGRRPFASTIRLGGL
jgi:hypothetical protein